jgi:hypothetical protein
MLHRLLTFSLKFVKKMKRKNIWNYSEFNIENGINLSYFHYLLKGFNLEKILLILI